MSDERQPDLNSFCENDSTWPYEAYEFVLEAIERASGAGPESGIDEIHLSGRQIAVSALELAREWFGLMAPTVFECWGIRTTRNLGEMVFKLIEGGLLTRQDGDRVEDFDCVFNIPDDLVAGYTIAVPREGTAG
ncbi:MAG: hypothetical protein KJS91_09660 [Planctomycetes bacterium]|jgi:uncharacterized repeat protein (TIGR04138 family)|nr:hypothetical protein [Planctomycetota bacterium]